MVNKTDSYQIDSITEGPGGSIIVEARPTRVGVEFFKKHKSNRMLDIIKKNFKIENGNLMKLDARFSSPKWIFAKAQKNKNGYFLHIINRDKKSYQIYEHRLIFALHNGYLPKEIDHINRDPTDNRIENLREVSRSENNINRKNRQKPINGRKFVGIGERNGKFRSYIKVGINRVNIGTFDTAEEAVIARNNYITNNNLLDRYNLQGV